MSGAGPDSSRAGSSPPWAVGDIGHGGLKPALFDATLFAF